MHIQRLLCLSVYIVTSFGFLTNPLAHLEPGKYRLMIANGDQPTMAKYVKNGYDNGYDNGYKNGYKNGNSHNNHNGYNNGNNNHDNRHDRDYDDGDEYERNRDGYRDHGYNDNPAYVIENQHHHVPGIFEVGGYGGGHGGRHGGWGPEHVAGHFFDAFGNMVGGSDYDELEVHPVHHNTYEIGRGNDALTYLPDGSVVVSPNRHHRNQRFTLKKIEE